MNAPTIRLRPGRTTAWLLGGLAVTVAVLLVTAGATSLAWGSTLRDEQRLLPGTTVAGVEVGGSTLSEAREEVTAHLEPRLDREVDVVHDEQRWTTTPRELGVSTDTGQILEEAFERTLEAGLSELTRMRWAGADIGPDLDVALGMPEEELDAFIVGIADEIDRDARDAEVAWTEGGLEVTEGRTAHEVDVDAAVPALTEALMGDGDDVELVVETSDPEVTTAAAEEAAATLTPLIDDALDHEVTLAHEGSTWTTSPRQLGATPRVEPALEATLAGDAPAKVEVSLPDGAASGLVASIAGELDVAPRNADLDLSGGGFDITPARDGLTVDRDAAASELRSALEGAADTVSLHVRTATASVTADAFDSVLVLRQGERTLHYYKDQQATHEWPVAVGQGGSPTPTGTFTIGAKRHEPVWVNPSPDGWGSDMPERIGPGPDNPMGTRALNWNDANGRDTLIRFHGTPNEDSIGEAASQGCVRMFNSDVEQLYDLIPSGTMVVSQR